MQEGFHVDSRAVLPNSSKSPENLTLKAPITTAADDNFFYYFSEKTSLDIPCELSAWQTIHMKCQDLFPLKNKKKFFLNVVFFNVAWHFKGLYI